MEQNELQPGKVPDNLWLPDRGAAPDRGRG